MSGEKKATRHAFGEAFQELFYKNPKVVGISSDLFLLFGLVEFAGKHKDRCFDVGVAEQNLISISAGLSTTGKIPFAMCFAFLASLRAVDQVKMCVAYSNTNVKIVVSHGGLFVGKNGPSHEGLCDFAIMRALPNMTIIAPSDAVLTKKATFAIAEYQGPVYLRLCRPPVPIIHDENTEFVIGKAHIFNEGEDVTIISSGSMVFESIEASKILAQEGVNAKVIEIHTIKPIDKKAIIEAARETGAIVTAEDHNILGGLGSAVAEVLGEDIPVPMERIGARDLFSESGSDEDLKVKYKMTAMDIVQAAKRVLDRKER